MRILGVDDFAFRRGHTYGTILIDMATHRPIDLLDSRDAAPVRAWVEAHPGVEVICRDRSSSYAEAARTAAPDAVQVADRYHLWMKLTGAVEECIMRHRSALTEPLIEPDSPESAPPAAVPDEPGDLEGKMAENRRARHRQVHELLAEGHSQRAITRHLGWSRNTVRRYANAERWQDMVTKHRPRGSKVDPYKPYLHAQWHAGHTNVVALDREIRTMGNTGSYSTVANYLGKFRPDRPKLPPADRPIPPTVRAVTGWLTRHPDSLDEDEQLQLKALLERCPPLEDAYGLVKCLARMLTELSGEDLPTWIKAATEADLPSLRRFSNGLTKDLDVVTAGLTLPYSSGAVEGNVGRLKMIKRKLYGRANLDLLRKLVLLSRLRVRDRHEIWARTVSHRRNQRDR